MDRRLLDFFSRESDEEAEIRSGNTLDKRIYAGTEDFVVNEARLFGKEGEIGVRTHTRYTDFPAHRHNYVEMMIVLAGSVVHRVGDTEIRLGEGEILMLNRHITHSVERSGEGDVGVNIIMSDRFSSSIASAVEGTVFSPLFSENRKSDGEAVHLAFTTRGSTEAQNTVESLLLELTRETPDMAVMTMTVSLLLMYLSRERQSLLRGGTVREDKESSRRMEILSYIKSNYRTATLGELSERMYITPQYLSRLVREFFANSFKELVINERLERAHTLFRTTGMPIGDIIRSVGYENESYFHRQFKAKYGMTPLSVRKQAE